MSVRSKDNEKVEGVWEIKREREDDVMEEDFFSHFCFFLRSW